MPREAKVVPPCNSPIVNIENKVLHAGGHSWKTAAGVALSTLSDSLFLSRLHMVKHSCSLSFNFSSSSGLELIFFKMQN
jgi:hypothetical protein